MEKEKKSGLEYVIIGLSILVVLLVGYIIFDKIFSDNDNSSNNSKLLELSKLEKYKNYNGSYGTVESLYFSDEDGKNYILSLSMDGTVYNGNYGEGEVINNVSDVIDIISFNGDMGEVNTKKCFMLTASGDVYAYNIVDLFNGVYEAYKVEDVKNVDRLVGFRYSLSEAASGTWGVIAVLENGEYVELAIGS